MYHRYVHINYVNNTVKRVRLTQTETIFALSTKAERRKQVFSFFLEYDFRSVHPCVYPHRHDIVKLFSCSRVGLTSRRHQRAVNSTGFASSASCVHGS